jgi:hypothetical protein
MSGNPTGSMCMQVLKECGLATGMLLSPSVLTAAAGEDSVASVDSDDEAGADKSAPSQVHALQGTPLRTCSIITLDCTIPCHVVSACAVSQSSKLV